jgi:hypothetical protein
MAAANAPIDSVAVKMAAGYNVISAAQWQALPSSHRFELVKAQRSIFMSRERAVPAREALRWLAANVRVADAP